MAVGSSSWKMVQQGFVNGWCTFADANMCSQLQTYFWQRQLYSCNCSNRRHRQNQLYSDKTISCRFKFATKFAVAKLILDVKKYQFCSIFEAAKPGGSFGLQIWFYYFKTVQNSYPQLQKIKLRALWGGKKGRKYLKPQKREAEFFSPVNMILLLQNCLLYSQLQK